MIVSDHLIDLVQQQKKKDFKYGYRAPTLQEIQFKNTVDLQAKKRDQIMKSIVTRSISHSMNSTQHSRQVSPTTVNQTTKINNSKPISNETKMDKSDRRFLKVSNNFDSKGRRYLTTDQRYQVFFNEFPEFKNLEIEKIEALIELYDTNLNTIREFSQPHLLVFGQIFVWFCWMMFNATSQYVLVHDKFVQPQKIIVNTMVTAAFAGLTFVFM